MQHLKAKLFASIVSLLLAIAMVTASSFAWFTLSTQPEIKGISTTVVVNDNLEIAYVRYSDTLPELPEISKIGDTLDDYTWGNLADFSGPNLSDLIKEEFDELETDDYDDKTFALRPMVLVKTTEGDVTTYTFEYPVYGKNGRVKKQTVGEEREDVTEPLKIDPTYGIGRIYREEAAENDPEEIREVTYGFFLDFWVRTNQRPDEDAGETTIPFVLSGAALRSSGDDEEDKGAGSKFTIVHTDHDGGKTEEDSYKNLIENLRVAFQDVTPDLGEEVSPSTDSSIYEATYVNYKFDASTCTYSIEIDNKDEDTHLLELHENKATLLRVYIYLDGENLENIDEEIPLEYLTVTLNLQFKVQGGDLKSMDDEDVH